MQKVKCFSLLQLHFCTCHQQNSTASSASSPAFCRAYCLVSHYTRREKGDCPGGVPSTCQCSVHVCEIVKIYVPDIAEFQACRLEKHGLQFTLIIVLQQRCQQNTLRAQMRRRTQSLAAKRQTAAAAESAFVTLKSHCHLSGFWLRDGIIICRKRFIISRKLTKCSHQRSRPESAGHKGLA